VALVAPRAAAAAAAAAAAEEAPPLPPLVHEGGSTVGCAEFFNFGAPMEPQLVQARSTTFTCTAACVINSVACFVWAGFAGAAPPAERADGRRPRGRRPSGFPYGVPGLLRAASAGGGQQEAEAEAELSATSFSSCDWDAAAGACAGNCRNLVVRLGSAPLALQPGDALCLSWHVSHAGPASAYALTASVERGRGGGRGVPPFRVELGPLYPTFRRAGAGEAAALDAAWAGRRA
jgi:hypothetical protein